MALPVKTNPPRSGGNARGDFFYHFKEPAGNIYYVHADGSATGSALTPQSAITTIDAAIGLCTASNGDHILVLPGHTETISAAAGIACDVAGVTIVGLGHGSQRPTITWGATDATWTVSAANVSIENIRCTVSVDEVVKLFSVTAAFARFHRVDFFETASAQAIQFLLSNTGADDLEIGFCRHVQHAAAASAQSWISLVGADRTYIHDNTFILTLADSATSAVIRSSTTACHDSEISRNVIRMTGYSANLLSAILDSASSRILVADNRIATDTAANTTINDCPSGWSFNNLATNAVDKSGIVDPVVDT